MRSVYTDGFQSTLPTRGSDHAHGKAAAALADFNPRSPRGGATALLEMVLDAVVLFQSTLPTRGSDVERRHGANL